MICPKCQTDNTADSRFCTWCGQKLTGARKGGIRWRWVVFAALMVAAVGMSSIAWWVAHRRITSIAADLKSVSDRPQTVFGRQEGAIESDRSIAAENSPVIIPVGTLVIEDITGNPLHRLDVPIVDGGWIAVPMTASLGGYRWHLWIDDSRMVPIEGGVFRDYDRVGIWHTRTPLPAAGTPLVTWNDSAALTWYGLHTDKAVKISTLRGCEELGYFIRCDLPYGISGPGIFLQDEVAVGWTFETAADGVFLWNGLAGAELTAEIRVDDHYRRTFAESREEKWLQALAEDQQESLQRLDLLITAYQYPRKLTDRQLPPNLDPEHIVALLQNLAAELAAAGYASDVVNRFDRQVLVEVGDPDLVIQVAELTGQTYGYEAAIDTVEWVDDSLKLTSTERERFDRIHREFYVRLLSELAMRADWASAAQRLSAAQTKFPDDPQLNLFEIRLALANGNWIAAERLLSARTFPESVSALVVELQSEIDRLKASDGKIVVRFPPGSRNIQVTAKLNGQVSQPFLIDTGATVVTIPTSTARRLGIPFENSSSLRTVQTAGGPVNAHEVTIDEIILDGWSVQRVTALVLDIPGQSDLGLLGLNYLSRFDMDLQVDKGLLTLTPK